MGTAYEEYFLKLSFTKLLEEDYYLRHYHKKTGYRTFGKLRFCLAHIILIVAILHPL